MYHLVKYDGVVPVIVYSCKTMSALRRYFNAMDISDEGMSFEVFDSRGQLYGFLIRYSSKYNASFIKSPQYGTIRAVFIWFARLDPEMGSRCRRLLARRYRICYNVNIVRFPAENFD